MLDGSEEAAEKDIKAYGSEAVIANGMIPFGKDPKGTENGENCHIVELDRDGEPNKYEVCMEGNTMTTFDLSFD